MHAPVVRFRRMTVRCEEQPWWGDFLDQKDRAPLTVLAEQFGVTVGSLAVAMLREGVRKRPVLRAVPHSSGDGRHAELEVIDGEAHRGRPAEADEDFPPEPGEALPPEPGDDLPPEFGVDRAAPLTDNVIDLRPAQRAKPKPRRLRPKKPAPSGAAVYVWQVLGGGEADVVVADTILAASRIAERHFPDAAGVVRLGVVIG